jgi:hypothetical protein
VVDRKGRRCGMSSGQDKSTIPTNIAGMTGVKFQLAPSGGGPKEKPGLVMEMDGEVYGVVIPYEQLTPELRALRDQLL